MTSVLAIDPGSSQSAWLRFDGTRPGAFGITANEILVKALRSGGLPDVVVIEKIESYGMAVGAEVFDTVWWAGRFAEAAGRVPVVMLPRRAVKLALCGDSRAKDANIRPPRPLRRLGRGRPEGGTGAAVRDLARRLGRPRGRRDLREPPTR